MKLSAALLFLLLLAAGSLSASLVSADPGVGVNLGEIEIDDDLSPGGAYNLPTLGVTNTGDEAADYEVVISYVHDQPEMRPSQDWFDLQPQRFFLEPQQTQNVEMRLTPSTGADPGDYFAFIEAHPLVSGAGTTVGVAAATKIYFTVEPSSWLEAQRVRLNRFLDENQPWTYILPLAALLVILVVAGRRYFRFRLPVERR